MARKQKISVATLTVEDNKEPTRYYGCISCGHLGDYKKIKHRGLGCSNCGYTDITPYDKQEYKERQAQKNAKN